MSNNNKNILYCSFCGKSQHEVRKLIAGPTVFICDECVELCMENDNYCEKDQDNIPKFVQERAWTSPIWIEKN